MGIHGLCLPLRRNVERNMVRSRLWSHLMRDHSCSINGYDVSYQLKFKPYVGTCCTKRHIIEPGQFCENGRSLCKHSWNNLSIWAHWGNSPLQTRDRRPETHVSEDDIWAAEGIGRGAKEKGGTVCEVSLSERDGERVRGQNTGRETSGKNESIKGSGVWSCTAGLETGRTGRLWNSLSQVWWDCSVQLLIMLRCKEQGLQASTRSWAELRSKSNRRQLLEVITSNYFTSRQIRWAFYYTERIQRWGVPGQWCTCWSGHTCLGMKMNHDQ